MFCEYCGKEVEDHAEFCPHCGMALENDSDLMESLKERAKERLNKVGTSKPVLDPPGTAKSTPNRSSSVINTVLAEGEVIIKRYNCADVKGAKGYLTVTNKRLMFNASGSGSSLSQEVTLSSVSGLTCYRGTNVNMPMVVIGAILTVLGIFTMAGSSNSMVSGIGSTIGVIFITIGVLLVYLGIKTAFMVAVYAKDVQVSPIVVGEGPRSFIGNSALFAIASAPTPETEIMLNELGALVQDLQSMGDLAIEKWQNRFDANDLPSL